MRLRFSMADCIFCNVISKNEPHHEIWWKDDNHIAFLDLAPNKKGHTLVIPRKHQEELFAMSETNYVDLMIASREVALLLKKVLLKKRIGVVIEGMSIDHIHVHLIPIENSGDLETFSEYKLEEGELEKLGEDLRRFTNN